MEKCILCGEPLSKYKTDREHYVPSVLIRNFKKLHIPQQYTHALRWDEKGDLDDFTLAPLSCHKEWATIEVHQSCNQDASPMCQDLKKIIDNLDNHEEVRKDRILAYYAHIWSLPVESLEIVVLTKDETDELFQQGNCAQIYEPGYLWVGRILIRCQGDMVQRSVEKHSIYLGPELVLEDLINDLV
jgi:hypothetical protein